MSPPRSLKITKTTKTIIRGTLSAPPDKSITHRAMLCAALTSEESSLENISLSADCMATLSCLYQLGVTYSLNTNQLLIHKGDKHQLYPYRQLNIPINPLDCKNSGTTMRILSGIVSAYPIPCYLMGDNSLKKRPMDRIIDPLQKMGLNIEAKKQDISLAIKKNTHPIQAIQYHNHRSSSQVKSCILFAGLFSSEQTIITESHLSRDHTERMFQYLGLSIASTDTNDDHHMVSLYGMQPIHGFSMRIPGDVSGVAFFIVATLKIPGSYIIIHDVNLNPTRLGLINILIKMGGRIKIEEKLEVYGEKIGTIHVQYTKHMRGYHVLKEEITSLIDEIPILVVLATQCTGTTIIRHASELRVKETDRIHAMCTTLKQMGANIKEFHDGMKIEGPCHLSGCHVSSYGDHRVAMSLVIANLFTDEGSSIDHFDCINISFPDFLAQLDAVSQSTIHYRWG